MIETFIVRLVSNLEAFFGDTLKLVSFISNDPFKSNDDKSYKVAELLSTKSIELIHSEIIDDIIRSVISKGYYEVSKFYKKRLNIDFSKSGIDLKKLEQLYDNRHLLVHNNGKMDDYYKHKYNIKDLSSTLIQLTEDYFVESIKMLSTLADFIYTSIDSSFTLPNINLKIINTSPKQVKKNNDIEISMRFKAVFTKIEFVEKILDKNFVFGFEEKYVHSIFL